MDSSDKDVQELLREQKLKIEPDGQPQSKGNSETRLLRETAEALTEEENPPELRDLETPELKATGADLPSPETDQEAPGIQLRG